MTGLNLDLMFAKLFENMQKIVSLMNYKTEHICKYCFSKEFLKSLSL